MLPCRYYQDVGKDFFLVTLRRGNKPPVQPGKNKKAVQKKNNNEIKHSAHSTYRCQYHIVFAPKFRRKEIYGTLKKDIGEILRKLCQQKGVDILEAEACPDHIHMLVCIPPHLSVAQFMGYLKGKSTLMIFEKVH